MLQNVVGFERTRTAALAPSVALMAVVLLALGGGVRAAPAEVDGSFLQPDYVGLVVEESIYPQAEGVEGPQAEGAEGEVQLDGGADAMAPVKARSSPGSPLAGIATGYTPMDPGGRGLVVEIYYYDDPQAEGADYNGPMVNPCSWDSLKASVACWASNAVAAEGERLAEVHSKTVSHTSGLLPGYHR